LVVRGRSTDPGQQSSSPSPTVTDNGVTALTANEILARSEAAALAKSSVHLVVSATDATGPQNLDLNVTKTSGASGTISSGSFTMSFVATQTTIWMKGDAAFWTKAGASPAAIAAIGNKWVQSPSTSSTAASAAAFTNYDQIIAKLMKAQGTVTKGETTDLNGRKAIILIDSVANGKMWIATTGDPLPMQTQSSASATATPSTAVFTEWGSATVASTPSASETIDINSIPTG
ncbi:MAG: hypothetical protein WCI74_12835, partial [Actinomycetes bacterium]